MRSLKIVFLAALPLLLSVSCQKKIKIEFVKNTPAVVDSIVQQVKTVEARLEAVSGNIKLNGRVVPNEALQSRVFSLVSGRVTSVPVELGDYVRKGQVLGVLRSAEVAAVANDVAVANANVDIARRTLESVENLYSGSLATEKELSSAKAEYNKALSERERAEEVFTIAGGNKSEYRLMAPISGYVIEKNITANSEIRSDNGTSLFTVADLSSVWILASVYESDINAIHIGDAVTVNTLTDPDRNYAGRIDKLYQVLDPETRTMRVRISMDNRDNQLKPEMFATVTVKSREEHKMLCVPSEAVVLYNSKRYVVVKKDSRTIEAREIHVVKRIGKQTFITGVQEGENVVVTAQVFLLEALKTH